MKRIYSCLMTAIAIVAGISFADAEVLTPVQALSRIESSQPVKRANARKGGQFRLVSTIEKENLPCVYIFENNGTNLVVSADDGVVGLLGYFDGNCQEPAPALQQWLDNYAVGIAAMRRAGVSTEKAEDEEAVEDPRADIAPLLTTLWDGAAPYNNLYPTNPWVHRENCTASSEAVAMAQVMNYHKWPQTEGETAFDWDNMLDSYTDAATDAQKNAVASLVFAAGESIDMGYGTYDKVYDNTKIASALIEKFNYDKGVTLLSKNFYSESEWGNIIYEQLEKYGPVILRWDIEGSNAYVCDGYQKGGFFHINWCNGRDDNGYFRFSVYYQENIAIVNITRPQADSSYRVNILSDDRVVIVDSENSGEFSHGVVMQPYTMMPISITGTPTILLVSDDKTIAATGQQITLNPGEKADFYKFALPDDIPDGNYQVMPVFEYNNQYLPIQTPFGAIKTASAVVSDGKVTFTNEEYTGVVYVDLDGSVSSNENLKLYLLETYGKLVNRTNDNMYINVAADIYDYELKEIVATTKSERRYLERNSNIMTRMELEFILFDDELLPDGVYYAVLKNADDNISLSNPLQILIQKYIPPAMVENVAGDRQEIVRMFNLSGLEVDKTTQSPGIYIVEIRNGDGTTSRHLIKK